MRFIMIFNLDGDKLIIYSVDKLLKKIRSQKLHLLDQGCPCRAIIMYILHFIFVQCCHKGSLPISNYAY